MGNLFATSLNSKKITKKNVSAGRVTKNPRKKGKHVLSLKKDSRSRKSRGNSEISSVLKIKSKKSPTKPKSKKGGKSVSFDAKSKLPKNSRRKKGDKSKKDKGVQVDEPDQTFDQERYKKLFGPPNKVDDKKDPKASTNNNDETIVKDEHKKDNQGIGSSVQDFDSKAIDDHERNNDKVGSTENKVKDDHQNHGIGSSVQVIENKTNDAHDNSPKDNHRTDSSVHDIEEHEPHNKSNKDGLEDENIDAPMKSGNIEYIYIVGQDETDKETERDDDDEGMEEESAETAPKDDEKKKDDSMETQ